MTDKIHGQTNFWTNPSIPAYKNKQSRNNYNIASSDIAGLLGFRNMQERHERFS